MSTQQLIADECEAVKDLLLKKNEEYGDSALNPKRIFSHLDPSAQIKVRIDDKLSRIMNPGVKDIKEDTLLDLIGYLILLRICQKRDSRRGTPSLALTDAYEEEIPKASDKPLWSRNGS